MRYAGHPDRRFGRASDAPGLAENDRDIAKPENRMREMHDGRIRRAEDGPHFNHATRQSDQFADFFAALLNGGARLEAVPAAIRQNGVLKIDRRRAEPATAGQDAQSL